MKNKLPIIILLFFLGAAPVLSSEAILFHDGRYLIVQGHEERGNVFFLRLGGGGSMSCEQGMIKEIRLVEDPPQPAAPGTDTQPIVAPPASDPDPRYEEIIEEISKEHDIDSSLVKAIVKVESNFNPRAVSPKGAQGLMQLMPKTAQRFQVHDVFNPEDNVQGGIRYLKLLTERYEGRFDLILAAYNAGEEAVEKYGGIPPYHETIDYILKVLKLYNKS